MIEVTRNQLAALRGCTPATVSRAKLRKTTGGLYNLLEDETLDWVMTPYVNIKINDYKRTMLEGAEDNSFEGLEADKLREEIKYKNKQSRKLDLHFSQEKNDLIPSDLIGIWIGYFASGLRNNFLTIAARVARNNKTLRNKIEKEITKAINKTLETAKKELEKYSKEIMETMEEE